MIVVDENQLQLSWDSYQHVSYAPLENGINTIKVIHVNKPLRENLMLRLSMHTHDQSFTLRYSGRAELKLISKLLSSTH